MVWTNNRALAFRANHPALASVFTDIRFKDITADPLGQVARIYHRAGLTQTPDAQAAMANWLARDRDTQLARHRYTASDFGLDETLIRDRFEDYYHRFLSSD